jgi:hypothetical protein
MERQKRFILRECPQLTARRSGDRTQAMINDQPVVKDPAFWITIAIGFSPILLGSVILLCEPTPLLLCKFSVETGHLPS